MWKNDIIQAKPIIYHYIDKFVSYLTPMRAVQQSSAVLVHLYTGFQPYSIALYHVMTHLKHYLIEN